jgi:hypothetical protein
MLHDRDIAGACRIDHGNRFIGLTWHQHYLAAVTLAKRSIGTIPARAVIQEIKYG